MGSGRSGLYKGTWGSRPFAESELSISSESSVTQNTEASPSSESSKSQNLVSNTSSESSKSQNLVSNTSSESTVTPSKDTAYGTIEANVKAMADIYPVNEQGFFGKKGNGDDIRVIASLNQYETADDFYQRITKGTVPEELPNKKGVRNKLLDGTFIVYRVHTKSPDSPAVEIRRPRSAFIKDQKIHFILETNHAQC